MKIAFVGLGSMGTPMASHLASAGHGVAAYRRTKHGDLPGGIVDVDSVAAACAEADVLVTMLPNDAAAREIVTDALATLPRGAVCLSMSTLSPACADDLAAACDAKGVAYVAAPVFGRPDAAKAAKLWICYAGPMDAIERCAPLFTAMGRGTTDCGDLPRRANLVKIGGNFLIASTIESLGEIVTLFRKSEVDPHLFLDAIGNVFGSPIVTNYGTQIADRRFEPAGFQLKLGLKDVRLALAEGDATGTPLPLASLLRDHLLAAVANGDGDKDWTATSEVVARMANA